MPAARRRFSRRGSGADGHDLVEEPRQEYECDETEPDDVAHGLEREHRNREEGELLEGGQPVPRSPEQPHPADHQEIERDRHQCERRRRPLRDEAAEAAPSENVLVVGRKVERVRRGQHARPGRERQRHGVPESTSGTSRE